MRVDTILLILLKKMGVGLSLFILFILLGSCGKSVDLGNNLIQTPISGGPGDPVGSTQQAFCGPDHQVKWQFRQPSSPNIPLDILFVIDTSGSMDNKRHRISTALPSFLSALPADLDYRIGVMLAHGGASQYSGSLYSGKKCPAVLDSKSQSAKVIQNCLTSSLENVKDDEDEANGEALMYSLNKSLDEPNFSQIQSKGFYRSNAALSVIFVTDENDICYPPELHGYSKFPDYVPSENGLELIAYQKYCFLPGSSGLGDPYITPEMIHKRLMKLKMELPLSIMGDIHQDPDFPPKSEESIGHGILELVTDSINGWIVDISGVDITQPMTKFANHLRQQLKLQTAFSLGQEYALQKNTVSVSVDGALVRSHFDSDLNLVTILAEDAGHSQSLVEITGCRM